MELSVKKQADVLKPNRSVDLIDWPRISVVTATYNQGQYIEETIRSILNQNYPKLEYIIIDGGSTDNTVDIIKKYESEITYWVSEKDSGMCDAINKGMKRATGEIVAWLNSDDLYAENTFFEVAGKYNELDKAGQDAFWLVGNCQAFGSLNWFFNVKPFSLRDLLQFWDFIVPQPSVFWNNKLLSNDTVVNEDYGYAMDLDLWCRLSLRTKPIVLNKTLSFARYYPETKTSSGYYKRYKECLQILLHYNSVNGTTILPEEYIKKRLHHALYNDFFQQSVFADINKFVERSKQQWKPSFRLRLVYTLKIIRRALVYLFK